MFTTSLGRNYWPFLLSQGICVSLGSGLVAVTSSAVIAWYLEKRRLLAGGIKSTGGGAGKSRLQCPLTEGIGANTGSSWCHSPNHHAETYK